MKLHIPTGPALEASLRSLAAISKIMSQIELNELSSILLEFNCEDAQVSKFIKFDILAWFY